MRTRLRLLLWQTLCICSGGSNNTTLFGRSFLDATSGLPLETWSEWSPCSVTCGNGKAHRIKYFEVDSDNGREAQKLSEDWVQPQMHYPYFFVRDTR